MERIWTKWYLGVEDAIRPYQRNDKLSIALALTATVPTKVCRTPTAVHCAGSS